MAEDDLDAFFDEVSAAEAQVAVEDDNETKLDATSPNDEEEGSPASKKLKSSHPAKPKRPLGVVVAASSSVPSTKPAAMSTESGPVASEIHESTQSDIGSGGPSATFTRGSTAHPTMPSHHQPPTLVPLAPPLPPGPPPGTQEKKIHKRAAAGTTWVDPTLDEWPENDYRIFVGNLSKDVTDEMLFQHFSTKYTSVAKAKLVRDKKSGASKGFGFVSLLQPLECARAIREQDQTWLSSRPIRVKRSDWKDRELNVQRKREKKRKKHL